MIKNIKLGLLTLVFGLLIVSPLAASAALVTTDATVNGVSSVTLSPSASVTIGLTTEYDGSDWKGTSYAFATTTPLVMSCHDNADYGGTGTSTESFSATAPSTVGVYDLYVQTNDDDTCTGTSSGNLFTLPNALTVQATAQSITFDTIASTTKTHGDAPETVYATSSSLLPVTFSTTASSTVCTVTSGGLVTFTGVGSCDVTANQAGDMIYAAATPVTQIFTISPASLTLDTVGAIATKEYDATTTVAFSGTPITISTPVPGDDVSVVGTYATKNVGTSSVTLTLSGADAAKYIIVGTDTLDGNITPKALTITPTGTDKEYDANTAATVTYGDDRVALDDVTVSGTATFTDKHVGTTKNIDVVGISLTGADASNYTYSTTASTTANITAKALALTAVTETRVYDGTASSSIPVTVTLEGSDTYTAYQLFNDKTVAAGKTITPYITILDGNDGNNYTIGTTTATGEITAKELTLSNISIVSKEYDATDVATMSTSTTPTLSVVEAGDVVTADFSGAAFTYDDVNAGTSKTVTATGIVLTGADAFNYILASTTTTGDIAPRPITVRPSVAATKVYDTTTTSVGTPAITIGSLAGADTEAFTEMFADADVATGKTVNATGTVVDGNAGNNYEITFVSRTDGEITPATLTVTALGGNKVYDGNTSASSTLFDNRISTSTDTFIVSFASSTFGDKTVGTGKLITISGLTKTGLGADNYVFAATTITATADITAKTLTATAHVPNKVYDRTTNTTVSYTDDRVTGDAIGVTGTAAFNDKMAGTAKLVLLSSITLFGPDATNYMLSASSTTTADIAEAPVTVSFTADDKEYDATTTAVILTSEVSGIIGADDVTVSGGTAAFTDKNIGNGKTVTAAGFVLGGVDGNNYVITVVGSTTANITVYTLVSTILTFEKVYDATTTASVTATVTGLAGDDVYVATTTGNFDDKNAGTGKTFTVTGLTLAGIDAGNYILSTTEDAFAADITPLAVTATIAATDKVYDATDVATATCSVIGLSGDGLSCVINGAVTFDDKNVGTGKTVTATTIVLDGTDMGNYALTSTDATTTASVTQANLGVVFTTADKIYDATTTASILTSTTTGVLASDDVTVSGGTAEFDTATVGVYKGVTITGFSLSGTDVLNYASATTSTTTASITQKEVVIAFTAANKVFDGGVAATINGRTVVSGVIGTDEVTVLSGVATFANAAVATGTLVSANTSTFALGGAESANYMIATGTTTTTADITAAPVVPTGISQSFGGGSNGGGSSGSSAPLATSTSLTAGEPISTIATSTLACAPTFTKYMRFGRANDKAEVIKLQTFLNKYMGAKLPLTGFFGTMTRSAVMKFQSVHLKMAKPTGLVLVNTVAQMNMMACEVK